LNKITLVFFAFIIAFSSQAQNLSLPHMRHIGAVNSINPALKIDSAMWTVDILNIN